MGRKIFEIAEIVYKFIALNFLWLLFLIAGLGVFGFMPSTVALFSVVRDWIKGEGDRPLFSSYLKYFKADFLRSNILGILFFTLFYIIYVNFSFVSFFYPEQTHLFIYIVIIVLGIGVLLTFINLFSVMAHFEYKTFQYIKVAAGLVLFSPLKTLIQIIWVAAYVLIIIFYPKIFLVIGLSGFAYILMNMNYSIFIRNHTT